ncbi:hypothetical protein ACHAXN_001670 [Cyclotella atomus]
MKLLFSSVVFIAVLISSASSIDEEASERQIVKLQAHTSSQWPLYDRIVKNMAAVKNSEDDESRDEIPNKQVTMTPLTTNVGHEKGDKANQTKKDDGPDSSQDSKANPQAREEDVEADTETNPETDPETDPEAK